MDVSDLNLIFVIPFRFMCSFDQLLFENLCRFYFGYLPRFPFLFFYVIGYRISATFPLPILLCHQFLNYFLEICLLTSLFYLVSIYLVVPDFLNFYLQDHIIQFSVFLIFFSMTFSVSSKPSLRSLTSAFYFLHNDLKITTYNVNIFFLPLKFFCKYTFNQKS